jgi:nucleoside-diphosphate-sugar epimerase
VKRVLLTGATGFVGRACIAPLRALGYSVHTISTGRGVPPAGVTVWPGNLLVIDRIGHLVEEIEPSHLLHVAWDVTPGKYWTACSNLDWLAASTVLLRAFLAVGGRRAVGVGTCAEYAWTVDRYAEFTSPLAPATCYGVAKSALCTAFQVVGKLGVSTAWGRLFFPFGPGEHANRLLPSVITALLAGQPADCTMGTQIRDFLYIDDAGSALAALLDSAVEGPVNIASGRGTALRDVILQAASQVGRPDLVRLGALPIRPGDPPSIVAGTERLNLEVGFVPATTLEHGIERTIAYWADRQAAARPSE